MENKLKLSEVLKKYTMVIVLAVVVILFTANTGGKMLLPQNVNNLIAQNAYVFILATGMLFCILTGGNIDLSVGSVVCFVGAIGGSMMIKMGINPYLSLLSMALIGMLVGAWQGFWIAYVRIPPFIVTLAGMLMFRGLSNVVLQGMTLSPIPDRFLNLFNTYVPDFFGGKGLNITCMLAGIAVCMVYAASVLRGRMKKMQKGYRVDPFGGVVAKIVVISVVVLFFMFKLAQYKGIPNALLWVSVIIGIYSYISSKTTTGRYFYAVGGSRQSALMLGINVKKTRFLAHLLCGLLAGIGGYVYFLHVGSGSASHAMGMEMNAIASSIIGGTLLTGGVGNIAGTFVGVLSLSTIQNIVSSIGLDQAWWTGITVAAMLCLFLVVQSMIMARKKKRV